MAVWAVGLNLVLNLWLIWPLAEAGLALSTAIAAGVQSILLVSHFLPPPRPARLAPVVVDRRPDPREYRLDGRRCHDLRCRICRRASG